MSIKYICPQCQSPLQEVLDSDGGIYFCRSEFHGRIAPQFTAETLEKAYGVGSPDKALPVDESRPTQRALDGALYWGCSNCGAGNSAVNSICAECKTPRQ